MAEAVNASEVAKVAVEDNQFSWTPSNFNISTTDINHQIVKAEHCQRNPNLEGCSDARQKNSNAKSKDLPFLFYVMPEHITPFLSSSQKSVAETMKPIMKFNRLAATTAGYTPYVFAAASVTPTTVKVGSATSAVSYHATTPKNERNALGYISNTVTGGLGGGALNMTKNTTQAITVGVAAAYSNQIISNKGDDFSVKPSHVVNGFTYGAGKYLGNYNCGDLCQTSITVAPNASFGKISDELYKKYTISIDKQKKGQ
ncbi:hypothetical protein LU293_03390 [Moraxella nasovis]|uniref:hypothetical protein n=1 Tax=Moraxella nasovis TaxID=2904121 RepID=UPI001F625771|nr:hypothetical protein LU293_03390 [Moraxella nasovis]